jgi:hypothetical protein
MIGHEAWFAGPVVVQAPVSSAAPGCDGVSRCVGDRRQFEFSCAVLRNTRLASLTLIRTCIGPAQGPAGIPLPLTAGRARHERTTSPFGTHAYLLAVPTLCSTDRALRQARQRHTAKPMPRQTADPVRGTRAADCAPVESRIAARR